MKPWKPTSRPKPPSVPKKPEQHEQLLAGVARIEEALKKQIKIEILCSCCVETQKEILAVVKDIQRKINIDLVNAATTEEVNSILGPVLARMKQVP